MPNVQLVTNCEGLLALNDNAFELCREFIKPLGVRLFQQLSRYDDYLAKVAKRPGYQAGDTLKLILPFLKAAGLTNARIEAYSRESVTLVPGAEGAFKFLHSRDFPIFAVSASYRPFAEAVGEKLGFAKERIFATELDLDRFTCSAAEAAELPRLQEEIAGAPDIELPSATASDLPAPVQEAVGILDRIFWERLPSMEIGAILQGVTLLDGPEKAKAVADSLTPTGLALADIIYVGGGNTDVAAFEAVRAGSGLAISFNGESEAVGASEVIVVSDSAWSIALLTAIFQIWGKEGVLEIACPETRDKSRSLVLPEAVIDPIFTGLDGHMLNLYDQNAPDFDKVVNESQAMRAKLRGEAVAGLE